MIEIIRYLILSTLIWGVLVLVYPLISRAGSFEQRRWYMLLTLSFGALLPLVHWTTPELPVLMVSLPELNFYPPSIPSEAAAMDWTWTDLFLSIYFAGLFLRLGYYLLGSLRLIRLCRQGIRSSYMNSPIFLLPFPMVPFHVMGQLYFPRHLVEDPNAFQMAFRHEQAHQQLGHGIDLLLGNLAQILFWFQPLTTLIVRELRLIHEYQADQTVIHDLERDNYARFLVTFRSIKLIHPAIHTLNQSPLKQRIMQMYQTPTAWKLPHFAVFFLLAASLLGTTAFKGITWMPDPSASALSVIDTIPFPDQLINVVPSEESFAVVEVMPRFPGCEEMGLSGADRDQCAQRKMLEYVYNHLKYPEEAIRKEVEGTSIASFIIEKDGSISTIKILRDIGGGTGEETSRVLRLMQEDGIRWIPGEQGGKKVRVEFKLPVKFKLTDKGDKTKSKKKRKSK
ncbi:MAG: M56 family metallopeptidase [Saprospiraceae bacterium]|nr:M56 family metallopeptidase [Saprospiraceae bacterium]